jgi:hypothetical protein
VIDLRNLERALSEKPDSTFSQRALCDSHFSRNEGVEGAPELAAEFIALHHEFMLGAGDHRESAAVEI